jgi:hypothetical protein
MTGWTPEADQAFLAAAGGTAAEDAAIEKPARSILGEPVDLTAVDTSDPRPWTRGAHRIVRPGNKVVWFSPRGVGKSLAAKLLAVQIIEEGGSVIYVDLENGARRMAERLDAILTDRDPELRTAISERLDYRPHARIIAPLDPDLWLPSFAGRDLAVIDSMARALGHLGLDENSNADVARFMVEAIDPIAAQGTAVLLLDNVGHDEANRTRGGSAKLDLTELAYKVTADSIAPDKHGTIRLERVRTRDGDEAIHLEVEAGDGTYGRLGSALPGENVRQLDRELTQYVQDHPGQTTEEVAKGIGKRKGDVRSRLVVLEDAGTVHRAQSPNRDRAGRRTTRTTWNPTPQGQTCSVPPFRTEQDRVRPLQTESPGPGPLRPDQGPSTVGPSTDNGHTDLDPDRLAYLESIATEDDEHS